MHTRTLTQSNFQRRATPTAQRHGTHLTASRSERAHLLCRTLASHLVRGVRTWLMRTGLACLRTSKQEIRSGLAKPHSPALVLHTGHTLLLHRHFHLHFLSTHTVQYKISTKLHISLKSHVPHVSLRRQHAHFIQLST